MNVLCIWNSCWRMARVHCLVDVDVISNAWYLVDQSRHVGMLTVCTELSHCAVFVSCDLFLASSPAIDIVLWACLMNIHIYSMFIYLCALVVWFESFCMNSFYARIKYAVLTLHRNDESHNFECMVAALFWNNVGSANISEDCAQLSTVIAMLAWSFIQKNN